MAIVSGEADRAAELAGRLPDWLPASLDPDAAEISDALNAWYAVPAACLLVGSPPSGALLYGLYGLTRSAAAVPIMAAGRRAGANTVSDWLLARRRLARRILGADLSSSPQRSWSAWDSEAR